MGSLLHMKTGGDPAADTPDPQSRSWPGQLFCVLFAMLLVTAYILGSSELRSEGKLAAVAAFICLFIGMGLMVRETMSERSRDLVFKTVLLVPPLLAFVVVCWGGVAAFDVPFVLSLILAMMVSGFVAIPFLGIRKAVSRKLR